jgi:ribonuclease D
MARNACPVNFTDAPCPDPIRLNPSNPHSPHTDALWIADRDGLDSWLAHVNGLLAVDTEFMRTNTYYARLALIQLAHAGRYALVDPLALHPGQSLSRMDERDAPTWIMHSPSEDLEVLAPLLPHGPGNLFDTQLAAAFVGMGLGTSYRTLVETFCGVFLDKGETRSNWMQRPLTDSQLEYATLDVVYLHAIHENLQQQLIERDRMTWFQADCERLKQRTGDRASDEQPQRSLRGASSWPRERQALLRRVLLWREATARELDQPRPWLLQDAQIMSLAEDIPGSTSALAERTRGQRALRGPQRKTLLDVLHQPVTDQEMQATAPIPAALDSTGKRALNAMKQDVNRLAEQLDLPPGLLAARKMLEEYIATWTWPDALQGWRHDLLHEQLSAHLPG